MSTPFTGTAESRVYSRTRDNPARLAHGSYWTLWTLGLPRHANQRSQLHYRLIEFPGAFAVPRHQLARQVPDLCCTLQVTRCTTEEHAPEHPVDVGIDGRHGLLVGKRRDSPCCVGPDTGQLDQIVGRIRQRAAVVPTDHARKRVEIRSSRVVAEAIPSLPHRPGPSPRQRFEIGEALQKPRIVLRHAAHLRLLQHELGDEHAVRIAGLAPRQIARGAGPPGEQLARKCLRARWLARAGGGRTGHGYPRYSP